MAVTFQALKSKSGSKDEISRLLADAESRSGARIARKVSDALRAIGKNTLANKIRDCSRGKVCSSIYCVKCRNVAASRMEQRLLQRFRGVLKSDTEKLEDRWRYLTVLCDVTEFKLRNVSKAVDDARYALKQFQKAYGEAWICGTFEFELVDLDDVSVMETDSSVKLRTLRNMVDDKAKFAGRKILVHYHAVVDIGKHDDKRIRKWFAGRYRADPRQVELKRTRMGQDPDEKIRKMASYGFKNRLQFNPSFVTRGYETGAFFKNKDAGKLIALYHSFIDARSGSYRSLLIGIGR